MRQAVATAGILCGAATYDQINLSSDTILGKMEQRLIHDVQALDNVPTQQFMVARRQL